MNVADISAKSTKNEILEAYYEAFEALKEAKKVNKQALKQEKEKKEVIASASEGGVNDILNHLASLKLAMVHSLESLGNQLLEEHKKFQTLQDAIQFQQKELEELHDIKAHADTLGALLHAQKEKKERFEKEMKETTETFEKDILAKRQLWKKEQEETEAFKKEQELYQKKIRQREEEDYQYKRDLERQKEKDAYEAEKKAREKALSDKEEAREKEFSEREAMILSQEQAYKDLKIQVDAFPEKLQKALQEKEQALTERLTFKYDHEAKLAQKEIEGERKLYQQKISDLTAKIEQQDTLIKALTEKASDANRQVQEIAIKAIDGASRTRVYAPYPEKASESSMKT